MCFTAGLPKSGCSQGHQTGVHSAAVPSAIFSSGIIIGMISFAKVRDHHVDKIVHSHHSYNQTTARQQLTDEFCFLSPPL